MPSRRAEVELAAVDLTDDVLDRRLVDAHVDDVRDAHDRADHVAGGRLEAVEAHLQLLRDLAPHHLHVAPPPPAPSRSRTASRSTGARAKKCIERSRANVSFTAWSSPS